MTASTKPSIVPPAEQKLSKIRKEITKRLRALGKYRERLHRTALELEHLRESLHSAFKNTLMSEIKLGMSIHNANSLLEYGQLSVAEFENLSMGVEAYFDTQSKVDLLKVDIDTLVNKQAKTKAKIERCESQLQELRARVVRQEASATYESMGPKQVELLAASLVSGILTSLGLESDESNKDTEPQRYCGYNAW